MTRKHFIAIAADLKAEIENPIYSPAEVDAVEFTGYRLAATLATFNPGFSRSRFLAAAGIDPSGCGRNHL